MEEIPIELLFSRGTAFLWLYTSPYGFWKKYDNCNNGKDWNYIFWRFNTKMQEQDFYILIRTSHHCYTVTHYCILDGFNEIQKFGKLFDAAQYLLRSAEAYEKKYAAYKERREKLAEEKKKEKAEKEARKRAARNESGATV